MQLPEADFSIPSFMVPIVPPHLPRLEVASRTDSLNPNGNASAIADGFVKSPGSLGTCLRHHCLLNRGVLSWPSLRQYRWGHRRYNAEDVRFFRVDIFHRGCDVAVSCEQLKSLYVLSELTRACEKSVPKRAHEIAHPIALLSNLRSSLKPGARIGIIDRNGNGEDHGVSKEVVIREAAEAGYELHKFQDFVKGDEMDYFLIFTAKAR